MLNSKPNNKNYHQGNYIPNNKDKVLKLNDKGGIYYRSSWELKVMTWLDNNKLIEKWGAECITVPYQMTHYKRDGDINLKSHCYYPDFYYEIRNTDGTLKKVVAEVKPMKEYLMVKELNERNLSGKAEFNTSQTTKKRLVIPNNANMKQLRSFEYDLKMAQKNAEKWETMIKFCDKKGWEFIIITESIINNIRI